MPQPKLGNIRVIFPNSSDIPQFSKLEFEIRCKSCFKKCKMGERFAVVSEEDKLACRKSRTGKHKKSTSYAVNVFDGKLLVNVSFNCQHK